MNLIGEHIDYEGYSVLPMAIRQDTIVAIRKVEGENVLKIANVNSDKYSLCTYPADPDQVLYKWCCFYVNPYGEQVGICVGDCE